MPTTGSFSPSTVELGAATLAALETITVLQGTSPWVIGDGGGSITIDGTITADVTFDYAEDTLHTTGDIGAFILAVRNDANAAMTTTNGEYSPIAVNANGAIAINDGGNSITVDGSVSITGTVDTELPAASALADNEANPSVPRVGAMNMVFDGATWDRWTGAITDGGGSLTVDGTVTVNQGTSPWVTSLDAATLTALESITVQNGAGGAAVNIQDGGNSITVDGAVTVSGTVATNAEKAESSAHASGHIGDFVLAVRNDAGTPLAADGQYIPFTTDATGALRVNAGVAAFTGRDDTDNQAPVATGLQTNVVRNYIYDGANWDRWTGAVTQGTSPWVTSLDAATLTALESITVQNGAGGAAVNIQDGGNSITVDGTVTVNQGTSPWVTSLDAASLAALESITVQNGAGAGAVNIQDGGNSITVDGTVAVSSIGGTVATTGAANKLEDDPHSSAAVGDFVLAVRNDAGTPLAANGDYIPFTTDANGDMYVTTGRNGSLANGAETAVTNVAAQILAANTARKKYIVQNVGAANIRVGITGVTATTGFRLIAGGSMVIEMPNCPTNAIFAIREGATNSIAFAQEIT